MRLADAHGNHMFARSSTDERRMRRWASTILISTAALSSGCAGPITQTGTVSSTDVRTEQLQQLRLAAELALANQQRVDRLAAPLLDAAGPLCGRGKPAKLPKVGRGDASLVSPSEGVCPFQVLVPHDDQLNAAADGSKIYVATAMLRFANDDELSAVLAHEIGRASCRERV